MPKQENRFVFNPSIPIAEVRDTLKLAELAVVSTHGTERLRLEVRSIVDEPKRSVVIEGNTSVARCLAAVFLGFVVREFGAGCVRTAHDDVSVDRDGAAS